MTTFSQRTRSVLRLLLLLALAGTLSCTIQGSFSVSFKISLNARILSDDAAQRAEVTTDSVTLPAEVVAEQRIEEGSILVADTFLRRVTRVERANGKATLATEEASLADVVEDGETSTIEDLGERTEIRSAWGNVSPKTTWSAKGFEVDIVHRSVVEDPKTGARLWLDGKVYFRPVLELGMKFGTFRLQSARAVARGDFGASMVVTGKADSSLAGTYSVVLWRSPKFSVPLPPIGPVSVKFTSQLTLRATIRVASSGTISVRAGIDVAAKGAYGFSYEQGQIRPIREWSPSASVIPPTVDLLGTLNIRAGLRAELDGGFYGGWGVLSAGGGLRLSIEPYADLNVAPTRIGLRAGLNAESETSLRVLWRDFPSQPTPLYDGVLKEWKLDNPPRTAACSAGSAIVCGALPGCAKCKSGESCFTNTDCGVGVCAGGMCSASAGTVPAGGACRVDGECRPGSVCTSEIARTGAIVDRCRPVHCSNQKKDLGESDIDCGGGECPGCGFLASCLSSPDCEEGRSCVGRRACF